MRISWQFGIIQEIIMNIVDFLHVIFGVYEFGVLAQFGPRKLRV